MKKLRLKLMDQTEKESIRYRNQSTKSSADVMRHNTDPEKNTRAEQSRAEQSRGGKQRQTKSLYLKQQNSKCNSTKDQNDVKTLVEYAHNFAHWVEDRSDKECFTLAAPEDIVALARDQMLGSHVHPHPPLLSLKSLRNATLFKRVEKGWQEYVFWLYTDLSTWYR
jgi:hypothetical protein